MSLLSSLNTGAAGLETNSIELEIIGDNIANANTVGFKASRAAFQEQLARTVIGQGPSQVGLGARLQTVQRIITQGALTTTSRATDVAIDGGGLFIVKGAGTQSTYYTRAGQFTFDKDGYLVNLQGLRVQGFSSNAQGVIQPAIGDLQVGTATSPPLATTTAVIKANLSSTALPPAVSPFAPGNAVATSNYVSSISVYDSLGAAHQVDTYFVRTVAGWDYHALTDGGGLTGGTAGTATEIANGTLTFGASGQLTAKTTAGGPFNPKGAVNPQAINWNFGTSTGAGGTGLDGITQFASPSSTSFLSQDGYPAGDLASLNIDKDGQLVGAFTNGRDRVIGQLAVANFQAEDTMERVGGNLYRSNLDSGPPNIGAPGTGPHGAVVAGTLEQSNVDMAGEFVRMIAAQRGFQANSKTLTTADQLLAELMTLKR